MRARLHVWLPVLTLLFAIAMTGVSFSPGAATRFAPGVEAGSLDLIQVGELAPRVRQLLGAPLSTTTATVDPGTPLEYWHYSAPRHTDSHWAPRCVVLDRRSQRVVRVDSHSLYDWPDLLLSML